MNRLLTTISIAGLLLPLAACAGQPWQVQPVLGTAPAPISSQLAADEEGDIAEPSSDCRHELGRDSDTNARASYDIGSWVTGCFVDGDAVDAFVMHAREAGIYRVEFRNRGGSALTASIVGPRGDVLSHRSSIVEGQLAVAAIEMQAGESYVLMVENEHSANAWYELKAAPQTAIVAKR